MCVCVCVCMYVCVCVCVCVFRMCAYAHAHKYLYVCIRARICVKPYCPSQNHKINQNLPQYFNTGAALTITRAHQLVRETYPQFLHACMCEIDPSWQWRGECKKSLMTVHVWRHHAHRERFLFVRQKSQNHHGVWLKAHSAGTCLQSLGCCDRPYAHLEAWMLNSPMSFVENTNSTSDTFFLFGRNLFSVDIMDIRSEWRWIRHMQKVSWFHACLRRTTWWCTYATCHGIPGFFSPVSTAVWPKNSTRRPEHIILPSIITWHTASSLASLSLRDNFFDARFPTVFGTDGREENMPMRWYPLKSGDYRSWPRSSALLQKFHETRLLVGPSQK